MAALAVLACLSATTWLQEEGFQVLTHPACPHPPRLFTHPACPVTPPADPHPGNLLRTRDGKLAYLDFGMMGQVDATIRRWGCERLAAPEGSCLLGLRLGRQVVHAQGKL